MAFQGPTRKPPSNVLWPPDCIVNPEVFDMNNVLKGAEALLDKGESSFDAAKHKLSQVLESGSDQLIAGSEAIKETAQNSADSIMQGANYLRTQPTSQMLTDCRSLCKKYPIQAMTLAAVAGLFLGKSIWGSRQNR
jgi:hypothetical protein